MHSVTYLLSELPYVGCKSLNLIPNLPSSVCTGSYLNLRRLSAVLYIPCYLFLLLLNPINWLILSDEIFVPITICFWDETKALLVVFKLYKNVSLSDFFLKVWGNFEHRIWICWSLWKQFKQRSPFLREKKKEINFRFSLSNLFFFKVFTSVWGTYLIIQPATGFNTAMSHPGTGSEERAQPSSEPRRSDTSLATPAEPSPLQEPCPGRSHATPKSRTPSTIQREALSPGTETSAQSVFTFILPFFLSFFFNLFLIWCFCNECSGSDTFISCCCCGVLGDMSRVIVLLWGEKKKTTFPKIEKKKFKYIYIIFI